MDTRKVLIIDDERDLCHVMMSFLKQSGYEVSAAYSLSDGMTSFSTMHPDVVIIDNNLPDGLGWESIPDIQAMDPACKIILISANKPVLYPTGKVSVLEKPISLSLLQSYL